MKDDIFFIGGTNINTNNNTRNQIINRSIILLKINEDDVEKYMQTVVEMYDNNPRFAEL